MLQRLAVAFALVVSSLAASAQSPQVGCFPLAQSTVGPIAITEWCQILEVTGAAPLIASADSGLVTLMRGFSASNLHLQYDDWYAAMDTVIHIEIVRTSADIVLVPVVVGALEQDVPIALGASAGDRIRVSWDAAIMHSCTALDNCGLHFTLTFD